MRFNRRRMFRAATGLTLLSMTANMMVWCWPFLTQPKGLYVLTMIVVVSAYTMEEQQ